MAKNNVEIEDMVMGEPYACHFKATVMLDENGLPAQGATLGSVFPGPGFYEGFGIIKTRDMEGKKLRVMDLELKRDFVVDFDSVWGVDTVEVADGDK